MSEPIKTPEQSNFEKFETLFPEVLSGEYRYLRLESQVFEPLSLEWIGHDTISMMHTYELNGDLCYDPDIVFQIDAEAKTLAAVSYEQSIPPMYQEVYDGDGNPNKKIQGDIDTFLGAWLDNISAQGYLPVRANTVISDEDTRITFDAAGNPILPEPEIPVELDLSILSIPDLSITMADRDAYGYTQEDMYPLLEKRAIELFDAGSPIYLLYPDNTEMMVFDKDEIITFEGMCGITAADWELARDLASRLAPANDEASREANLLYGPSQYGIYQIRDDIDESRNFRYASFHEMEAHGLGVNRNNYELVYTAPLTGTESPENIFQRLNVDRPFDFMGHSASVSDVIVMQRDGNVSAHYVDSMGFRDLPSFTGNEAPIDSAHDHETYSQLGNTSPARAAQEQKAPASHKNYERGSR